MAGVGDICTPGAPERALSVGCEILSSLVSWGFSKRLVTVLARLDEGGGRNGRGRWRRNAMLSKRPVMFARLMS